MKRILKYAAMTKDEAQLKQNDFLRSRPVSLICYTNHLIQKNKAENINISSFSQFLVSFGVCLNLFIYVLKQCNHLTKQACVTYRTKYLPCCGLFFRFVKKMKKASQGGLFSMRSKIPCSLLQGASIKKIE